RDAIAQVFGDQLADGRLAVEELDDDARIEERGAVVEHERGDLAQRVVRVDRVLGRLHVDQLELALDLLFGEHDAHFARVRAGESGEELHEGARLYRPQCRLNAPAQRGDDLFREPRIAPDPGQVAPARVRQREALGQILAQRAHGFGE